MDLGFYIFFFYNNNHCLFGLEQCTCKLKFYDFEKQDISITEKNLLSLL